MKFSNRRSHRGQGMAGVPGETRNGGGGEIPGSILVASLLCRPDGAAERMHHTTHRSPDEREPFIEGCLSYIYILYRVWRHILASTDNRR